MARGKKITKKKLKEPDEFISFSQKAFLFVTHYIKQITTGGIIVLIFLLAFFLYLRWEKKNEIEAYQKFSLAIGMHQMVSTTSPSGSPADYKKPLEKFDEVIEEFPRTSSGKLSFLYKGNIHLGLDEYDEAIKAYQTFLQNAGKEKLYRLFALEGLGYSYEGKKDFGKALDFYQKILEMEGGSQFAHVYLSVGRCYEKLGKDKEALENYKTYLKVSQKSQMTNTVLKKISLLEQ